MSAIDVARPLAEQFEGRETTVYLDPVGLPTGGVGHMDRSLKVGDPISDEQIDAWLEQDLMIAYLGTIKQCPGLITDERKAGAITDFCFNLGVGRLQTSTLRRKINAEEWDEAADQLLRWVYAGGRKLPGLIRRRAAEREVFNG